MLVYVPRKSNMCEFFVEEILLQILFVKTMCFCPGQREPINEKTQDHKRKESNHSSYEQNVYLPKDAKKQRPQRMPSLSQKQYEIFVRTFSEDVVSNYQQLKMRLEEIVNCKERVADIKKSLLSFSSFQLKGFQKIKKQKIPINRLSQQMIEPFILCCNFAIISKNIILDLQYFLEALEHVIVKGYRKDDSQYETRKIQCQEQPKELVKYVERLMQLAKTSSKEQRSKILPEDFGHSKIIEENQLLRESHQKQQVQMSNLLKELKQIKDDKLFLQKVTIPKLKGDLQSSSYKNVQTIQKVETIPLTNSIEQTEEGTTIVRKQHEPPTKQNEDKAKHHSQILNNKDKLHQMGDKIGDYQHKVRQLYQQIKERDEKVHQLNLEIIELKKKTNQMIQCSEVQKTAKIALQSQKMESKLKILELEQQLQSLKKENQNLKVQQSLSKGKDKLELEHDEHDKLKKQVEELKKLNISLANALDDYKTNTRMRTQSFVDHKTLFIGEILQNCKEQKRFLIDSIENHMGKCINKTNLLYDLRKNQKIIFHDSIDNHSNLVFIVQTAEHALIAGYYSGKYAQKTQMKEEAMILSLNNAQYYLLNTHKNNPKRDKKDVKNKYGMVYDSFFLIFGNSELRIRHGQHKLFSNFGINNAYFDSRGRKVDAIIGEGKKNEVPILNYEIHQVFFEQFELEQLK